MTYSIYCITNRNNQKMYIGLTGRTVLARWRAHCASARNGSLFRFHAAIRHHGEDAWDVGTLLTGLTIEQARIEEERLIYEHDTVSKGYNAKPGGCGGWIVPNDKIESWKTRLSDKSGGSGNPNYSGFTDDEIVRFIGDLMKNNACSVRQAIVEANKSFGTPLTFTKRYRFVEYGGGRRGLVCALCQYLGVEDIRYRKTDEHRQTLRERNTGKRWYTHAETGICVNVSPPFEIYETDPFWIRGRKQCR